MKQKYVIWMVVLTVGLLVTQVGSTTGVSPAQAADKIGAGETPALKTQKERASYGIGVEIARNFKRQKVDVDPDLVMKGMKDALAGDRLLLTEQELLATMNFFGNEMTRKRVRDKRIAALDNKKEGEEFLAANKTREGVVTLPSGLQYKILKAGDGKKPTETDTVACQYRGTLIDGTEFETTRLSGQAAMFSLSDTSVIPGLREALKLMPEGSKWQLFIPPRLAYAGQGSGQDIGPNTTLIFELELLAVESSGTAATGSRESQKQ